MSTKHLSLVTLTILNFYSYIDARYPNKSPNQSKNIQSDTYKSHAAPYKKNIKKPSFTETIKQSFKAEMHGFIKHEAYWDSRQVVGFDQNEYLAYPKPQLLDSQCNDINAQGQFNMIDVESFLHLGVYGPEIFGAKSYGHIEANFFGINENINTFALYTIIIKLIWEKGNLIAGEWWHPFYLIKDYPRTVQFNTGAPIAPVATEPGFFGTYTYKDKFDFTFAALSATYYTNDGPEGLSTKYQRNAIVPRITATAQYHFQNHVAGIGIDYKRIKPRLSSIENDKLFKVNEHLNSVSAESYIALHFPSVDVRSQITYGENSIDLGQIGGYAVSSIDPTTGEQTYKNLRTISWWLDINIVKSKKVVPGIFIGYLRNIGASDCIIPNEVDSDGVVTKKNVFGFGENIKHEFRIAPRIKWHIKWLEFALEFDYTSAGFGTVESNGKIENVTTVANKRLMFATYYKF